MLGATLRDSPYWPPWRDGATFIATFGGAGLLPRAPGTWGSLAALPFGWLILEAFGWRGVLAASLLVAILGWWASRAVLARTGSKDPGAIVIDEVAGQLLCLSVARTELWHFALAFAVFRVMDILKPFPANLADRKAGGGFGVMADDIVAGIYALAATAAVLRIAEGRW